jgi:hypothetical protein|tara:strand:- start:816 stop:1661 length:846 start_codon:yes stop_codon:yes gene_type:complete
MALPGYLEDTAKDYAKQATAAYSVPIDTSKFTGRQFVAGEDPLQTQAIGLATQGVGSYAPYLTAAQQAITAQGGLTGAQAYQPFMSPYQTDVIDETLRQYDLSRTAGQQAIRDAAVGSGNFGGGREGAMMGQYDADTLANRAGIRAGLLQQGLGQAQLQAQQAFQNQGQLAAQQFGLSNFQRAGLGSDVGALGQLGSLRQGLNQAQLTADQQAAQTGAYEPYGRLSQYGQGITGLTGGVAAAQYQQPQQASPMSQALSTALGVGGLYQKMFHPQPMFPGMK